MKRIDFRVFSDHKQMSEAAAQYILGKLKENNRLLLCPAAGNTPIKMYEFLAGYINGNKVNTKELRVIKLDEWGKMSSDNPASCEYQIRKQLLDPLQIRNYYGFDTNNKEPDKELLKCDSYLSQNGPIDICVLGLGLNGHLGFNEPAKDFLQPFSHRVSLSPTSLKHDMISDINDKPKFGLTLGMQSILTSKTIVLLVSGTSKKQAFAELMKGQIDTNFPASFLWLHNNVICFCDKAVSEEQNIAAKND